MRNKYDKTLLSVGGDYVHVGAVYAQTLEEVESYKQQPLKLL